MILCHCVIIIQCHTQLFEQVRFCLVVTHIQLLKIGLFIIPIVTVQLQMDPIPSGIPTQEYAEVIVIRSTSQRRTTAATVPSQFFPGVDIVIHESIESVQ